MNEQTTWCCPEGIPQCLPPEVEEGNVEYKLQLLNPSSERLEHLITQMKWRLQEGDGEAFYKIGIENNGYIRGLSESDMAASLATLNLMAKRLGATVEVVQQQSVSGGRLICEVLVRRAADDNHFVDMRVAVLGNVDVGKSTLLGVLTTSDLDNGRGKLRTNLFRHLHEVRSGRTSSISHDIVGFSSAGQLVNYKHCQTTEDICRLADKVITLIDLAGHPKYLKTTMFGLTSYLPHFAMLCVSARTGVVETTKEHFDLLLAMKIPTFVVITKIDNLNDNQRQAIWQQVDELITSGRSGRSAFSVGQLDDVETAAEHLKLDSVVPVLSVSSVTGQNLSLLIRLLYLLPTRKWAMEQEAQREQPVEFLIDQVFSLMDVGTVVGGLLTRGCLTEGQKLLVGPTDAGNYNWTYVKTVRRNRLSVRSFCSGQTATLGLSPCHFELRKGMVLLQFPACCWRFVVDIHVLYRQVPVAVKCQVTVHVGNVCQTARIIELLDELSVSRKVRQSSEPSRSNSDEAAGAALSAKPRPYLGVGQRARVLLEFMRHPEYVRENARVLLRDGCGAAVGHVVRTFNVPQASPSCPQLFSN